MYVRFGQSLTAGHLMLLDCMGIMVPVKILERIQKNKRLSNISFPFAAVFMKAFKYVRKEIPCER